MGQVSDCKPLREAAYGPSVWRGERSSRTFLALRSRHAPRQNLKNTINSRMAYCITKSFGLDRIRARVPEWHAAMRAGRDRAPKCGAKTRAGTPCARLPIPGTPHCYLHLHGKARDVADLKRKAIAEKRARSTNALLREEGLATLRTVQRRQLHRAWKLDPTIPGSTLTLTEADEARVRQWLRDTHHIDLDQEPHPVHATGQPITARATDRLRWAGTLHLAGRMDAEGAARRVFVAMRDDRAFWAKREGTPVP